MNQQVRKRARVLLADDHIAVIQRVSLLLQSVYDVVGAVSTGREMVSEGLRLRPDVIVADISMPDITGIEAAHQLRARGSLAKFVFLTIHSEDEFIDACMAEGALGYVVKTHMKSDLIPAINAALAGRSFVSPT
ncbi:MAG TPA: response regulator transcription factor [Terriglobales bacterium]|nr:response regulator transcription factor [Terriglobales bacterium]